VLPSWLPVPGLGALPVNSFLLKGAEPMLVDTGLAMLGDAWIMALEGEVDPEDLRWIWLSHMDADHIGNLTRIIERAPNAKVVTNFLGAGKMGMMGLDASRVHLLNPGDTLEVGGRTLTPVRPPYYDAPETIGFVDAKDGVFFAADSFGALLPEIVHETGEADANTLRDGLVGWSSIDAPWLAQMDRTALSGMLKAIERIDPAYVLSGHLPLARGGIGELTRHIGDAYGRGTTDAVDPLAIEQIADALH
jgi:glyoxylase-like metal-dependent hydrolase (beta-lactamase superfamily II)